MDKTSTAARNITGGGLSPGANEKGTENEDMETNGRWNTEHP
jgi:hypothetical protein